MRYQIAAVSALKLLSILSDTNPVGYWLTITDRIFISLHNQKKPLEDASTIEELRHWSVKGVINDVIVMHVNYRYHVNLLEF